MLDPLPPAEWNVQAAAHLLNRAGFGGAPEEIKLLHALGNRGAVDALLEADEELDLFPAPEMEPLSVRMMRIPKEGISESEAEERKKIERQQTADNASNLREWWLRRMRETPNPAREKATLFWHGHWATGLRKVGDPFLMHQQNETLRAHALGPFAPLAKEITRDPAMIQYLDLQNSSPKKPNENFAREFLELFTLGEGHYSEADIAESARAFTGHRVARETGRFQFLPRQADTGVKTVLGKTGALNGDDVVEIIVATPRCSEFLAGKIWKYYAGTPASAPLQRALGHEYRRNGMDTGKLLRAIFSSRVFYSRSVVRQQIKSPVCWLVQMCKLLEIEIPPGRVVHPLLTNLGQALFDPPNVNGWDGGRAWISASTLLARYNAAGSILRGSSGNAPDIDRLVPQDMTPEKTADILAWRVFQSPMSAPLRERTLNFLAAHGSTLAARRELLHLLMSTPEFQLT